MSDVYFGKIHVGERVGCKSDTDIAIPVRFGKLEEIWIEAGLAWAKIHFDGESRPQMADPALLWPESSFRK